MPESPSNVFYEDIRQKSKARPKVAVGKVRPRTLVLPPDTGPLPWWKAAPAIVWVDLTTGKVLVFRWPLE